MSRLNHDLKDLANSLNTMKNIVELGDDELIKMKAILSHELARLLKIVDHIQAEAE